MISQIPQILPLANDFPKENPISGISVISINQRSFVLLS